MTNSILNTVSLSTIKDVRMANDMKSDLDVITGDWIYSVDPESMQEVKSYYKTLDGSKSLFNAFCEILSFSKQHDIKF